MIAESQTSRQRLFISTKSGGCFRGFACVGNVHGCNPTALQARHSTRRGVGAQCKATTRQISMKTHFFRVVK